MKPRNEGAAWDLTPDTYEMVNEPGSERSEFFQPDCNHPEFWPGNVMGFDYTGGAKVKPADDQLPASSPPEAREDDMRKKQTPEPNYDRIPHYPPQQMVNHENFQLREPAPRKR